MDVSKIIRNKAVLKFGCKWNPNVFSFLMHSECLEPEKSHDFGHDSFFWVLKWTNQICPISSKYTVHSGMAYVGHISFASAFCRWYCSVGYSMCWTWACTWEGAIPEAVCSDTEELSSWFHSNCQTFLDIVAPLKTRRPKTKSKPWFSDRSCAVRWECKCKKDSVQVSLQMLRDCWLHYQETVKDARRKYFTEV